jgi:hypothetical protein
VEENIRASVTRRVLELLESRFFQLPPGLPAVAGEPLPVMAPGGAIHSWMVPFIAGAKLVAWAQLSPSLAPLRLSVLGGGRMDVAPDAADWLDTGLISAKIAAVAGAGATLSSPVLTYDRDPSRLVWMVESRSPGGALRRWFSTGGSVWEDAGHQEVTGGPPHS